MLIKSATIVVKTNVFCILTIILNLLNLNTLITVYVVLSIYLFLILISNARIVLFLLLFTTQFHPVLCPFNIIFNPSRFTFVWIRFTINKFLSLSLLKSLHSPIFIIFLTPSLTSLNQTPFKVTHVFKMNNYDLKM